MSVAPSSSQTSVASESKSLRSMFSNIHNKGFVPPKAPLASPKNPAIRKILDIWAGYGFPLPETTSKGYRTLIWNLKRILKGTYFVNKEVYLFKKEICPDEIKLKKFTIDEIIQTIDYFNLAAWDYNYHPSDEFTMKKYRRTPLPIFFFNPFGKRPYSLFFRFYKYPPIDMNHTYDIVGLSPNDKIDENLYKSIIAEYAAHLHCSEFGKLEDAYLKKSAILTKQFFTEKAHLMKIPLNQIGKERFMARWLIRSVINDDYYSKFRSKISPSLFVQPWVYNRILPGYLHDQAVINIKTYGQQNFSSF